MQDLVETIANAPIYHLRAVLQLVCAESEEARSQAEKSFKDLHVADQLAPVGRKRKAEIPVDMCLRCKEPFYPDANKGKDCRYHDGALGFLPVLSEEPPMTDSCFLLIRRTGGRRRRRLLG